MIIKKIRKIKYNWCGGKKGSVLVISLIIFGIIVVTALSVALTTVRQMKTSIQSSKTNIAYQNADEGVDRVMTVILRGSKTTIASGTVPISTYLGGSAVTGATCCSSGTYTGKIVSGASCSPTNTDFFVELYDASGSPVLCDDTISDISTIAKLKSFGNDTGTGTQRIVEANVEQKDAKIKLLLHMDASIGVGSSASDSSRVHHAVSAPNNITIVSIGSGSTAPIIPNFSYATFNGTNQYLSTTDITNDWIFGTEDYTVDFWAYIDNTGDTSQTILQMTNGGNDVLKISFNTTTKIFSISNSAPIACACTKSISDLTKWHHIAVVRDTQKMYFYVDGKSDSTGECNMADCSNNYSSDLSSIKIGAENATTNRFKGRIDEFRLFADKAWSTDFSADLNPKAAY
jgi:hypothetical protein